MPASSTILCRYAAFLARSLVPDSIKQYLNCVRLLHLESGLVNPIKDNWPLTLVLRGISRTHGRPPAQKLPITPGILHRIREQLDLSDPQDIVFWAACLVAFFSFCRKASLVPKSVGRDSDSTLCRHDVQFVAQGVVISIRKTKTIQCRQRVLEIPLHEQPGSTLCPVAALRAVWSLPPVPADKPLFAYQSADQLHVLDYQRFTTMLTAALSAAGFDTALYSGHSLRRGGASCAFQAGAPPAYIKLQGDWKSSCWERYVHIPLDLRWRLSACLAKKAASD